MFKVAAVQLLRQIHCTQPFPAFTAPHIQLFAPPQEKEGPVVNLSRKPLTTAQISLPSKGLFFVPSSRHNSFRTQIELNISIGGSFMSKRMTMEVIPELEQG